MHPPQKKKKKIALAGVQMKIGIGKENIYP
jgi:hypothetical protein